MLKKGSIVDSKYNDLPPGRVGNTVVLQSSAHGASEKSVLNIR